MPTSPPNRQRTRQPTRHEDLAIAVGDAAVSAVHSRPATPFATVVVAHGAGAGMEHPFLIGFTDALNDGGAATLRFNFPYREAGRRFPDRPPVAIATWRAAMDAALQRADRAPVWAAGKSFGGRMASMAVADGMPAAGLVFLGYPLHAPGKPEKPRDAHLYGLDLPMLFLQGTRDPFALPGELEPVAERIGRNARIEWTEGGDHSFHVARSTLGPGQEAALLAGTVLRFLATGA